MITDCWRKVSSRINEVDSNHKVITGLSIQTPNSIPYSTYKYFIEVEQGFEPLINSYAVFLGKGIERAIWIGVRHEVG